MVFVLFILKRSAEKGFWYQIRVTDNPMSLRAIIVEWIRKKVEKFKLNIKLLTRCWDGNLYPRFTKFKRFKKME